MTCPKCGRKCMNVASLTLHARSHKRAWKALAVKRAAKQRATWAMKRAVAP
jgi:hypothetical protein